MEAVVVLLSIRPAYTSKILQGSKKCEFRREPPRRDFRSVFIYASAPVKKIVAFARVEVVVEEEIEILWGKYGPKGGIKKSVFESYFKGKQRGAAIVFSEIQQLLPAIDPYELVSNFVPPQNYRYLSEEESRVLVQGAPTIDRWEL